jgi:uncharacterized protein (DUF1501 family)
MSRLRRRDFLRGAFSAVGVGALAPAWLARATRAQEQVPPDPRDATDPRDKILVVLELAGGNDGLNTVVPFEDDRYHQARPTLRIDSKEVLRLDDRVGLHPSLAPLHERFPRGEIAVVQGVGYPGASRSHFRSMEIWHAARVEGPASRTGWLGRWADVAETEASSPALLVHLGRELPLAMRREQAHPLVFDGPETFSLAPDPRFRDDRPRLVEAFRRICGCERAAALDAGAGPRPPAYVETVRSTAASAVASADEVLASFERGKNAVSYPGGFAQRLALVARMIAGGMTTRVYYVSLGGFDTHSRQKGAHANLLSTYAGAVDAFFDDLEALGRAKDVLLVSFSEFGRRVAENGSAGTDHGTAGPMFLVGPAVAGGVHGDPPDLEHLVDGDPTFGVDFRSVYAAVIRDWLGGNPPDVLGAEIPPLPLLRSAV